MIQRIFQASESLNGIIKVIYLPNYNISVSRLLTAPKYIRRVVDRRLHRRCNRVGHWGI